MNQRNVTRLIRQCEAAKKQLAAALKSVDAVKLELDNLATQASAVGSGNAKTAPAKPAAKPVAKPAAAPAKPAAKPVAKPVAKTEKKVEAKPVKNVAKTDKKVAAPAKSDKKAEKKADKKSAPAKLQKAKPFPNKPV